ncbi:MAG: hypothetical protein ACOZQL_14470 [Myxococcota bacterium]
MLPCLLLMLLSGEPERFLGGASPTPASKPGPVDQAPSLLACSTTTLRDSSRCVFDARPEARATDAAKKKQAVENVELARRVSAGLCAERAPSTLSQPEKQRRIAGCVKSTALAAEGCSLDGAEVLLDAEGRFSPLARRCYTELATALQLAELPPPSSP